MKDHQRSPLKYAHGAVVCLRLKDFMQFSNWVEFYPGPYLNVVVGPNGSGKSSLVNGIGLALGAKTGVLGRASELHDYIRNGCDEATIEIELFNENERNNNFKIKRVITRPSDQELKLREGKKEEKRYRPTIDTDCKWWLNKEAVKGKKILDFVKSLNIQTDNLCQFLPQDKVHDFSKMDPKMLLVKTVEAIGNSKLRQDHDNLKILQREVEVCDGLLEKKENTLKMVTDNVAAIEQDVERFQKRKTMMDQIQLLTIKLAWNQVTEKKRDYDDELRRHNDQLRLVKSAETQLLPKRKQLDSMKQERQSLDQKLETLKVDKKKLVNEASRITKRKEEIPDDIENLNVDYLDMVEKEKEKEEVMKTLQKQYQELQREYQTAQNEGQNQGLDQELMRIQTEMKTLGSQQRDLEAKITENRYEQKSCEQEIMHDKRLLDQIGNVAKQKRETLQRLLPNGQDAVKAMDWLKDNRDKFQGHVYDPLLMGIDVKDAANNAKYLENIIPARDLVAFATENADDANKLMRQFREVMRLRVNVVQVDARGDAERLRCRSGQVQVPGFKAYAKDMFDCAPAIKHYLCKQYDLQNIPIFDTKAESHLNDLIQDFRLFFTGDSRHSVVKSSYSGQVSTSSSAIRGRNWLQTSVDKNRINQLEKAMKAAMRKHENLKNVFEDLKRQEQELMQNLEVKRKEAKNIKEKMDMKKVLQGKLHALKMKMERRKNENKPRDLALERNKMETAKEKFIQEDVGLAVRITENLVKAFNVRQKIDLLSSNVDIHSKAERKKRNEISEEQEELNKMKETLGELMEVKRQAEEQYISHLKVAQKASGDERYKGSVPPQEIVEKWTDHHFQNISTEEATARQYELEGQLEYMDEVDDKVEGKYENLRASKEQLETEVTKIQSDIEQKSKQIQDIRSSWVVELQTLVEQINEKFSDYFQHMGYCGEIELDKGAHDHDFANYGIEIKVKFRDKYQLQRLDPYKQSGGERSVSTALYMMAMQTLTAVPFRCVDEINQGMDETNERKVFDLLIETSVRGKKGGSQYFLLTPKLLHDLHFERGVNVHHVHNGSRMGFGKHVLMERFRKVAAERRRSNTQKSFL